MTEDVTAWQHCFINTNQIRLHCVTQGEGELVVLLHGFPEFWYSWRFQIPALSRYYKVVAPDLRGYNDSDKPMDGYDLDTLTADILGLIQGLGYNRAHVIGHDWGGAIAWHFAHRFPTALERLILLNAPHPIQWFKTLISNRDQLRRSWYLFAFQIPNLPEWMIQQNLKEFVRHVFQEQAIRKGGFTRDDATIYQAALEKSGVLRAALSYYREFLSPHNLVRHWTDIWYSLNLPTLPGQPAINQGIRQISTPTLVLWGADDPFFSHQLTEEMEKSTCASLKFTLIPHCGHWIQQEAPQTVNREILQFLRHPHHPSPSS